MRQRITIIQDAEDSIGPESLKVTKDALRSTELLRGAREDRLTFGFTELPAELRHVLDATHELHIRWATQDAYWTASPFLSRVSPGLHAFYTPLKSTGETADSPELCTVLKSIFGDIDCKSVAASFSTLPSERFSLSAAYQYYHPLLSLSSLISYLETKICKDTDAACKTRVKTLSTARSLDINYDTISRALIVNVYWESDEYDLHITQTSANSNDRVEVGILSNEVPLEPEELKLAGALTVIGENSKPSATLFGFPSRHHAAYASFSSYFTHPTGLHPSLSLNVSSAVPPREDGSCLLHAYLTLPRGIFPDKYQLSDSLFLQSKNLSQVHYSTSPIDLEAPSYAVDIWGSALLASLSPPPSLLKDEQEQDIHAAWTAAIPLHLRYLEPSSTSGISHLEVPYPVLFWACTAEEGSKFPTNPFDRVNLGYDGLFGPKTMFYHLDPVPVDEVAASQADADAGADTTTGVITPNAGRLVAVVDVPVLDTSRWTGDIIKLGTGAVVLLGFTWVLWALAKVWLTAGYKGVRTETVRAGKERETKKKK